MAVPEPGLKSIAHDVRNRVAAIVGFTQILKGGFGELSEENRRRLLEKIERNAREIDQIAEELGR